MNVVMCPAEEGPDRRNISPNAGLPLNH